MKLALKLLLRRKAFTAISLFGITLTLLVLVVASALVDGTVGASPPQSHADRMLLVTQARLAETGSSSTGPVGWDFLRRTVRDLPGAEDVTVLTSPMETDAWAGDVKVPLSVKGADAAFWRVHDLRVLEGATFTEDDDAQGRAVVVLGRAASRRLFGDAEALGREVQLGQRRYRVTGVVDDVSSLRFLPRADAFVPLGSLEGARASGLRGNLMAVVLARRSSDVPALERAFDERVRAVPLESSGQTLTAHADTLARAVARRAVPSQSDGSSGDPLPRARALLAALTAAFLALPVLNLVNLSLSRVVERAPEIGVRKAFGATPRRLVAQVVLENVVLVLAGGLVALVLAPLVLHALNVSGVFPGSDLVVNARVLAWGLFFALLFGVLSGAWPAWRLARLHPVEALRGVAR